MKLVARIAAPLLVCFVVLLTVDACRARSAAGRAKAVRIGDTKQRVRAVMGPPSDVTTSIFFYNETWAYGGYVDWEHLTSHPIRFRIFASDTNEVAIRFDGSGRVSKIIVPGR